ncbi:MAG: DMT family transporter [Betaproteobacteria bacterium]|nr:DMT family transporter [Betaproteobacteria bacterium]
MLAVTLMWSIAGVVSRQLHSAASFEVTFWRSFFTLLSVGGMLALRHGADLRAKLRSRALWVSGACWAVMFTCFMLAITLTTVANVLITLSVAPLFTALLARLWLRRPLPLRTWGAIVAAGAGIAWMYSGNVSLLEGRNGLGVLVALCVPVAAALNWNLSQRNGGHIDLIPAVLVGALLSSLVTLPLALPFRATGADLAWLALLGVVQLGLPCMLAVWCAARLPAPEISLLALLEVIFGVLWAWLGAGEQPSVRVLTGGAVVLAALAVNELWAMREKK